MIFKKMKILSKILDRQKILIPEVLGIGCKKWGYHRKEGQLVCVVKL